MTETLEDRIRQVFDTDAARAQCLTKHGVGRRSASPSVPGRARRPILMMSAVAAVVITRGNRLRGNTPR